MTSVRSVFAKRTSPKIGFYVINFLTAILDDAHTMRIKVLQSLFLYLDTQCSLLFRWVILKHKHSAVVCVYCIKQLNYHHSSMFSTAKIRVWLIAENNVLDANFICHHLYLNNSIYTVLFSGIPSFHTPQLLFSRHWRYTGTVNYMDIGRGRPIYIWKLRG